MYMPSHEKVTEAVYGAKIAVVLSVAKVRILTAVFADSTDYFVEFDEYPSIL